MFCSGCSKTVEKTLLCGRCKAASFCSKECQTMSWAWHKGMCKSTNLWGNSIPAQVYLSKERATSWHDGLAATAATEKKLQVLRELCVAAIATKDPSKALPIEGIGRLNLIPSISRALKGDNVEVQLIALKLLTSAVSQSKLNGILLYNCGGLQDIADMVFLSPVPSSSEGGPSSQTQRRALALSALLHGLISPQDGRMMQLTLLKYSPEQVLVPRVLALMKAPSSPLTPSPALARQHAQATKLLTLCITLDTEVPLAVWAKGFDCVLGLVRYYSKQSAAVEEEEGEEEALMEAAAMRADVVPMLMDICALINGFIDHFVGAVELILGLGLPELLGLILSFPEKDVQQTASLVSRLAISCTSSVDSINTIVGYNNSLIIKQAVEFTEEGVADKDIELLKPSLGLAADCLRAESTLLQPYLPSLFASMVTIIIDPSTYAQVLGEALSCFQGIILFLPTSIVVNGLLNQAALSSAIASLLHVSASIAVITVDIIALIAKHSGPEGLTFLEDVGALGLLKHLILDPKHHDVVTLSAAKALEELLLAQSTDTSRNKLKGAKSFRDRIIALAAKDAEYRFLAEVVSSASKDLKDMKIWEKNWLAYAGLQRSVMRSGGGPKVSAFLKVRGETCCGKSKREFQEDDKLVRLVKCRHWYEEEAFKEMVLSAMQEHQQNSLDDNKDSDGPPWARLASQEVPLKSLKCLACHRSIALEFND